MTILAQHNTHYMKTTKNPFTFWDLKQLLGYPKLKGVIYDFVAFILRNDQKSMLRRKLRS